MNTTQHNLNSAVERLAKRFGTQMDAVIQVTGSNYDLILCKASGDSWGSRTASVHILNSDSGDVVFWKLMKCAQLIWPYKRFWTW